MSRWTHIRGAMEFYSDPFEYKKCKYSKPVSPRVEENNNLWDLYWDERYRKAYLPYPKEQFELSVPKLQTTFDKEAYTLLEARVFSLPRARKYIEEAFKLLPQGECGINYTIKQDKYDCRSSSSDSQFKCINKAYEEAVVDLYQKDFHFPVSFKELKKWFNLELRWINDVSHFTVSLVENIRYCSGQELFEGLEKFFEYLKEKNIHITTGYLEWTDEYEPEKIYAWRCCYEPSDSLVRYRFMILDAKTNKMIYSKVYRYKDDDYFDDNYVITEENFNQKGEKNNESN